MRKNENLFGSLVLAVVLAAATPAWGQRARFPEPASNASFTAVTAYQAPAGGGLSPVPQYGSPYGAPSGGASLGQPAFDPYSTSPQAADQPPVLYGTPTAPPFGGAQAPSFVQPPPFEGAGAPYGAPGCGPYPNQAPPALFPNGFGGQGMWGPGAAAGTVGPTMRLFQGLRLQHTWIYGDEEPRDLSINDTLVSLPMAYPNFAYTGQPILISPSFALHLWDGPHPPLTADLPGNAYSAFFDASWRSDPNRQFGAELGTRVGVFTDFDTFNKDSIRTEGLGLIRLRLTPTTTLRGGALYLDRADVKILPAGGLLWEPNPQTRFDIFFPKPKLAQYLTTIGNQDFWWYIAGEYGGGSWTIERADGRSDRIDINDIRLIGGIEFGPSYLIQQGHRRGFVEAGWVTDRQLVFVKNPQDSVHLDDSAMVRAGLGW